MIVSTTAPSPSLARVQTWAFTILFAALAVLLARFAGVIDAVLDLPRGCMQLLAFRAACTSAVAGAVVMTGRGHLIGVGLLYGIGLALFTKTPDTIVWSAALAGVGAWAAVSLLRRGGLLTRSIAAAVAFTALLMAGRVVSATLGGRFDAMSLGTDLLIRVGFAVFTGLALWHVLPRSVRRE